NFLALRGRDRPAGPRREGPPGRVVQLGLTRALAKQVVVSPILFEPIVISAIQVWPVGVKKSAALSSFSWGPVLGACVRKLTGTAVPAVGSAVLYASEFATVELATIEAPIAPAVPATQL